MRMLIRNLVIVIRTHKEGHRKSRLYGFNSVKKGVRPRRTLEEVVKRDFMAVCPSPTSSSKGCLVEYLSAWFTLLIFRVVF